MLMSPMRDRQSTSEDRATQLLICEPLSFAIKMCKMCSILGYLCFTFPPIRYNCAVGMLRPIRRLCRADSRTQWKLSKYLTAVLTKAHKSYPLPARRQQHSIRKVPSYPLLDWFQSVLLTDPKFLFENNDKFPSVIYSLH